MSRRYVSKAVVQTVLDDEEAQQLAQGADRARYQVLRSVRVAHASLKPLAQASVLVVSCQGVRKSGRGGRGRPDTLVRPPPEFVAVGAIDLRDEPVQDARAPAVQVVGDLVLAAEAGVESESAPHPACELGQPRAPHQHVQGLVPVEVVHCVH